MNLSPTLEECISFHSPLKNNNRRRSLFPSEITDSESDSDIGHISPLNFDSNFENEEYKLISHQSQNTSELFEDTVGDYDILGLVENQTIHGTMSPLYISPRYNKPLPVPSETPSKISPSYKLKTPIDTCFNTNTQIPKLCRKSILDSSEVSNKRKLSPDNSPEQNKYFKLDPKSSRVRTTLFPEVDFALSTKLFYSKSENMEKVPVKKTVLPKTSLLFNTNRKPRPPKTRRKIRQINAGVHHNIKKPKPKKFNKSALVNTTLDQAGNAAITDYLMALKQLESSADAPKLIENVENKENTDPILQISDQIVPSITPVKVVPVESRKRHLSPEPEPDPNRKFFKFARSKGVVKVNKTIQLEVDHGKISLIDKNAKPVTNNQNEYDMSDLGLEEPESPVTNINNILSLLEEDEIPEENKILLQAHSSVMASENSILLHQPKCPADLILSPISQMCDVTSGLALNTPKKIRNLTPVLEEMTDVTEKNNEKLFPIFYPGCTKTPTKNDKTMNFEKEKKFKKLPENQMLLDAGQKKFGLTQCHECDIVYHMGDLSDEIMHLNYHSARHILRFQGWKNERVVADFQHNGKIIQLIPGDSKMWWKKANELMDVINQELGCRDMDFCLDNCQAFFYVRKKTIVGCLIAVIKSEGYKLLSAIDSVVDVCSETKYPIKCGIPRIWVSATHRKQGIATELMNALKRNFILGSSLTNSDIAFSSPTEAGKKFGRYYFKTDSFFIYYV